MQGSANGDTYIQARHRVPSRDAKPDGRPADLPGNAHHARQRLYDHVVGGLGAVGPGLTETADRRPNQLRTAGRDLLNIKADPARDAGPEVLHDNICLRYELQQQLPPAILLQVDRDALLVSVDREEVQNLTVEEMRGAMPA